MTSATSDLTAVEERLEKLERELRAERRCNRWLLGAVGLAAVGVVLAWSLANITTTAQAQGPKVIRANEFILEDQNGQTRVGLTVTPDGPVLLLLDEKGKISIGLSVDKDGPSLILGDETGTPRTVLAVDKSGSGLSLRDESGTARAILAVDKSQPSLILGDETGKVRVSRRDHGGAGAGPARREGQAPPHAGHRPRGAEVSSARREREARRWTGRQQVRTGAGPKRREQQGPRLAGRRHERARTLPVRRERQDDLVATMKTVALVELGEHPGMVLTRLRALQPQEPWPRGYLPRVRSPVQQDVVGEILRWGAVELLIERTCGEGDRGTPPDTPSPCQPNTTAPPHPISPSSDQRIRTPSRGR